VAVEKLDLPENDPKIGDRKCLPEARTSIVGLPNAKFFERFPESEFFNSHACSRQLTAPKPVVYSFLKDEARKWHFDVVGIDAMIVGHLWCFRLV
jgi:hypothetical protein